MSGLVVVSPHCDDAVLSCGSFLTAHPQQIVTLFAGVPSVGAGVTAYDAASDFASSSEAMGARREEDRAAAAVLGCEVAHLDFLDLQYDGERPDATDLADVLLDAAKHHEANGVLGPLGLQHPDHLLANEACLWLAADGIAVWLYEDLPYRVVWPDLVPPRLDEMQAWGWHLKPDFLGSGDIDVKQRAIGCYESQAIDIHTCLVPERFWRLCG